MAETFKFHFLITYFKPTGKYYTDAVVEWETSVVRLGDTKTGAYLHQAVAKLQGLRDNGIAGALPGLSSVGWDGPILIVEAEPNDDNRHVPPQHLTADDYVPVGVPHLLMPAGKPRRAYERI